LGLKFKGERAINYDKFDEETLTPNPSPAGGEGKCKALDTDY
jgi:hypothetical protein